jgi:GAF domain-containing protein
MVGGAATRGAEIGLLTGIVAATRERLGAAACSVALLDGEELVFRAAAGAGAAEVIGLRLPVGRGIAGWTVASGQAIAVADVNADRRFDREAAVSTGYVPTTILAVPVEDDEGPIGVLEVLDRQPETREMEIAALAAEQVARVIGLVHRQAETAAALADPRLSELVGLVRRLASADDRDRGLATALLRALLDQSRSSSGS